MRSSSLLNRVVQLEQAVDLDEFYMEAVISESGVTVKGINNDYHKQFPTEAAARQALSGDEYNTVFYSVRPKVA